MKKGVLLHALLPAVEALARSLGMGGTEFLLL